MSLPDIEAPAPPEPGHLSCTICNGNLPEGTAYRPHTLDGTCWCTYDRVGNQIKAHCWVAESYPDKWEA